MSKRKRDTDLPECSNADQEATPMERKRDTHLPECSNADQEATPMDTSIGKHEVFISHRGLEMKRKFANHLFEALKQRGITAFLDLKELPEGNDVRDFMLEAARRATIQVPIFTKIYPESCWCLDELVEMIKSTEKPSNAKVIPIFYDVKPEDLRLKDGPFAEAFEAHLEKRQYDEDRITQWKDALSEASWLSGFRLETYNQREGELLKDVVDKIGHELNDRVPVLLDGVGIEKRVNDVVGRFRLAEKTAVYFCLLWGMGGIGKTTLARAIYHTHRKEFDAASFVEDEKNWTQIQGRLRQDLLLDNGAPRDDLLKRKEILNKRLTKKKVLIVLDDMNSFATIEKVIDPSKLEPGSLFLVTSRDRGVFPPKGELSDVFKGEVYELQPMDEDKSLELFCRHAFKQPSPEPDFKKQAKRVVQACDGLPLSLKEVGRRLCNATKEKLWEEAIEKLRSNKYKIISDTLMSSYNSLNDEDELQQMFLDVACFLIGEHKRSAKHFWVGCEVDRLIDMCLVKLGEDKRLKMHYHLKYLGRYIVQKSDKGSRLWNDEDLGKVLRRKQDLLQIRGIATSVPKLDAALLSQMQSLQLLFLDGTHLDGDREGLKDLEIRWLKWSKCRHETLPEELLDPNSLTLLEVESNSHPWRNADIQRLSQLREISITTNTVRCPDFIRKMTELGWIEVVSSESRAATMEGKDTIRLKKKLKQNPDRKEERERNGCTLNAADQRLVYQGPNLAPLEDNSRNMM